MSTFVEILRKRALSQSEEIVYTFLSDGETASDCLTYQALHKRAQAIAVSLQSYRTTGERALLLYPPGLEFVAAFFGCLYAGVVAVPVYPPRRNQQNTRLETIIDDAEATIVLTTASLLTTVQKSLPLVNRHCIVTEDLPNDIDSAWQEPAINSQSSAFLQYTSGSTGTPKGVIVSHGNLVHNSILIYQLFGHNPQSRGVIWLPPYHDMGLIGGILQPIYGGFPAFLMSPVSFIQKPLRWLEAISRYRATTSGGPDFAYDLACRQITSEQLASLDLSSWEVAFTGAEPVRAQTLDRFAQTFAAAGFRRQAFYPCYGMAETTLIVSGGVKTQPPVIQSVNGKALAENRVVTPTGVKEDSRAIVGCGQSTPDQKIVIVDLQSFQPCPNGRVGEVWVAGPSVTQGYWNRPAQTQETFQAYLSTGEGPFLRTGDLGFLQDGELFITGRLKDLIIILGRNHYPQDIELSVEQCHGSLRPASGAAFSVEVGGQERLVVVQEVERTHLRKLDSNEIIGAIRRVIAEEYEIQVYAVLLLKTASLPKTSSGKVRRSACRECFLAGTLDVIADWSANPRCETEFLNLETQIESLPYQDKNGKQPTPQLCPKSPSMGDFRGQPPKSCQKPNDIETWLIAKVAERLGILPEEINIDEPLASYGLSSLAAVGLSGELQEWLGRSLSPTLLYDYSSIASLAQYLGQPAPALQPIPKTQKTFKAEPIAIIGIGCHFPGADSPSAFWQLLQLGVDAIREVPSNRWNVDEFYHPNPATPGKMYTRWGGFLDSIEKFDAPFFGISPREAGLIDPQQRLLLEVCWEALEGAGQSPEQLAGSATGVFIGISNHDYSQLQLNQLTELNAYSGTGNASSVAANRLSYLLDLRGPSWAVDTACSSSLVSVHQACQSLRQGECQLALAGGVNLILTPQVTITFSQAGLMSADGRCKAFDAAADGYVRSEGCGMVVLKRLSDALHEQDNILAVIRGSAINQDGRSNGLTAPNGLAQQTLIRQALDNAGIAPSQISYVEAHGTGTALGDPIELNALKAVFLAERSVETPLWVGSVKTNIGHLEAAAGIAGLIKVVLSLKNQEIPANLHLKQLNTHIDLKDTPLSIPTVRQKWAVDNRLAGVSSFGFGGTNVHVVLEEAPVIVPSQKKVERPRHLLILSAKTEPALRELAQRYETFLASESETDLANICFTANTGRSHFTHRLALNASSIPQVQEQLNAFIAGRITEGLVSGTKPNPKSLKVVFLFTGQGSQYAHMGRQLYETQPVFRQTLDRCDEILRAYLEKPLLYVLDSDSDKLNQTAYTQPALFAIEYALAQLWQSWGIEPAAVIGHSVGEYVAACVAGIFSLEDGLKLIAERGLLMQALPAGGEMVAVFAEEERVKADLEPLAGQVAIAAINGTDSIVIAGASSAVRRLVAEWETAGIKTRPLNVSHAFHSPLIEPMLDDLEEIAHQITMQTPRIPLVSNLSGQFIAPENMNASYWRNHTRETVQFKAGLQTLIEQGYAVFLEIGPKPTLINLGKRYQPSEKVLWLPSLAPNREDWQMLLDSLAQLYIRGIEIDWKRFEQGYSRQRLSLPTYPFQKKPHWIKAAEKPKAALPPVTDLLSVDRLQAEDVERSTSLTRVFQHQLKLMSQQLEDLQKKSDWKSNNSSECRILHSES
jgi:acyl transferase domain-containing protein/acyl-CoA synthetase (AMP-forming)/AMP-acid ligase II/acyl carrier protein